VKTQNLSERQSSDDAPLYIRWSPDRSPYAIELKLDLVPKILHEVVEAERLGSEVEGVLVGSFPDAYMPTVRIENIEIIPRDGKEETIYPLDPRRETAFSQVLRRARGPGTAAVGLFRSHRGRGPLGPTMAERDLLSAEFKQAIYVVLLVQAAQPHAATFFLAAKGQLPEDPAVREFRFNEADFKALPEVQPEALPQEADFEPPRRHNFRLYAVLAALVLIGLGACFLMWSFSKQAALPQWLGPSRQLQLAVTGHDHLLRISWNHAARELDGSSGATLVITDGSTRREIKLGLDELRLGAVGYDRSNSHVEVRMNIENGGASSFSESAEWDQK
jgi:hypothetical protein